ncbi:MAG: tandem-95 repeat protein [Alphaproteobacteria bacterium]|nr:tandem-95 repeat protein [Alphaproteobacteria bacterium]
MTSTATAPFNPALNAVDPDADPLTITAIGTPAHGSAVLSGGLVTYTPTTGYQGLDNFTYTVSDGHGHTVFGTVYASITNGIPPVAVNDSIKTPLNTPVVGFDPRVNDSEPNPPGYPLAIYSVVSPTAGGGTVAITGGNTTVTYTPATGYEGQDSFNYTITDGHQHYSTATVFVFVGAPPIAQDDYQPVPSNTATTFDPRVNDSDPNNFPLTIAQIPTAPVHGTVAINNGVSVTYTPTTGYSGADSFVYDVTNGHGLDATAAAHVCVGTNPPVANPDTLEVTATIPSGGGTVTPQASLDPRNNDSDPCGSALAITAVTQGAPGSVNINWTGLPITYTYPSVNHVVHTTDTFTYTITNAFGATATGTVTVTIDVETNG